MAEPTLQERNQRRLAEARFRSAQAGAQAGAVTSQQLRSRAVQLGIVPSGRTNETFFSRGEARDRYGQPIDLGVPNRADVLAGRTTTDTTKAPSPTDYLTPDEQKIRQDQLDALKNIQQRIITEGQAKLPTIKSDYEALLEARLEAMRPIFEQQRASATRQAGQARETLANRFAFGGFGQSTVHETNQTDLALQGEQIQAEIDRAQRLAELQARMEISGASEEAQASVSKQIAQAQQNIAQLESDFATKSAELRAQAVAAGTAASEKAKAVNTQLSAQLGYLVNDYGQPVTDKGGKQISIPQGASEYEIKQIGKNAYAVFNPATGKFEPISGYGGDGTGGGSGYSGGGGFTGAQDFSKMSYAELVQLASENDILDGLGFPDAQSALVASSTAKPDIRASIISSLQGLQEAGQASQNFTSRASQLKADNPNIPVETLAIALSADTGIDYGEALAELKQGTGIGAALGRFFTRTPEEKSDAVLRRQATANLRSRSTTRRYRPTETDIRKEIDRIKSTIK